MYSDFYKNKKVLVTGGSGSIGKKIVKELIKYDVDVIIRIVQGVKFVARL